MTDARSIVLLDADPDLGRLRDDERLAEPRRQLVVRQHTVEPGPCDGERLRDAGPEHVGLFIVDGLMTRELALATTSRLSCSAQATSSARGRRGRQSGSCRSACAEA